MPGWGKAALGALGVVGCLALAWVGYQTYVHVGDARATSARLDDVATAWDAASPEVRVRARAGDPSVVPRTLLDSSFREMGTTTIDGHRAEGSSVVVGAVDGFCGADDAPTPWAAYVKETDHVVVVLLRPRSSWLPDVSGFVGWAAHGTASCGGFGVDVPVRVTLSAPLGDRLLVDAGSGLPSYGDRVTTGQVTEPVDG